jgi:hypothetical protein
MKGLLSKAVQTPTNHSPGPATVAETYLSNLAHKSAIALEFCKLIPQILGPG